MVNRKDDDSAGISIEETNKLRAAAGLKPLTVPSSSPAERERHAFQKNQRDASSERDRENNKDTPAPPAKRQRTEVPSDLRRKYAIGEDDDDKTTESVDNGRRFGKGQKQEHGGPVIRFGEAIVSKLGKGESAILTMKDSRILSKHDKEDGEAESEDEDYEFENAEMERLLKGKRRAAEEEKIKEFKSTKGAAGLWQGGNRDGEIDPHTGDFIEKKDEKIFTAVIKYNDEEDDEDTSLLFGLKNLNAKNNNNKISLEQKSQGNDTKVSVKKKSLTNTKKVVRDWSTLFGDEENDDSELKSIKNGKIITSTTSDEVAASVVSAVQKTQMIKKSAVSSLTAEDSEIDSERTKKSSKIFLPEVVNSSTLPKWDGLRRDGGGVDENEEMDEELDSFYKNITVAPAVENRLVVPSLLDVVKEEESSKDYLMDEDGKTFSKTAFIDTGGFDTVVKKDEKIDPSNLVLTDSSEFCRQIWTPVQRFEEKRKNAIIFSTLNNENISLKTEMDVDETGEQETSSLNEYSGDTGTEDTGTGVSTQRGVSRSALAEAPIIDGSIASALEYFKDKGELDSDKWRLKRSGREKNTPLHKELDEKSVKIDYTDAYGQIMNPKQAFRQISWAFHGKGPGKKKKEKLLKKMELDRQIRTGSANPEESLPTMRALQAEQKKGRLFIQLGGGDGVRE